VFKSLYLGYFFTYISRWWFYTSLSCMESGQTKITSTS